MLIKFSPARVDATVFVSKQGDTLIINGEAFEFAPLAEGETLPAEAIGSDHFVGPVERINGELHLTLRMPHGPRAPEETRFPQPIVVDVDGPVALPPYDAEPEEVSE